MMPTQGFLLFLQKKGQIKAIRGKNLRKSGKSGCIVVIGQRVSLSEDEDVQNSSALSVPLHHLRASDSSSGISLTCLSWCLHQQQALLFESIGLLALMHAAVARLCSVHVDVQGSEHRAHADARSSDML